MNHFREAFSTQVSNQPIAVPAALRQVVVVRALPGLGDFLCVIPALRAVRKACPRAQISLIGLPNSRGLVERFSAYVDELIELPGYPGLPERSPDLTELPKFLDSMRSRSFDLAIQMHGSGVISNALTLDLKAARSIGFFKPGYSCPDSNSFLPYVDSEPEIRRYLRLLQFVGIPAQDETMEFPIDDRDQQDFQALLKLHNLEPGKFVCIHAGASAPMRCWSGDRFAAVADAISQAGWQIVLTGSIEERGLNQAIAQTMQEPAINLAGRTSLGALAALLVASKLLVCNDTGVSHLAAALRVKSVIVFSASDPQRWAPLDRDRHRAIVPPATVATVLNQVHELLQEPAYAA